MLNLSMEKEIVKEIAYVNGTTAAGKS